MVWGLLANPYLEKVNPYLEKVNPYLEKVNKTIGF